MTRRTHSGRRCFLRTQFIVSLATCFFFNAQAQTDKPIEGAPEGVAGNEKTINEAADLSLPVVRNFGTLALPRAAALALKPIDLTTEPDDIWQRIRRGFAIRNVNSPQVPENMSSLLADQQRLRNTLERAGPYLFHIVDECERRGLPTELALLPFIESSFNPHATSRAGAAGLWQFIRSTGRSFNLKQDGQQDERRDVVASTSAALDYLSSLYDRYGDWHLALAAYNWGQGSVRRALEKNRLNNLDEDYLSLSMPNETRNYVPKLQAFKNIVDSPEAFGFSLPPIENKPYFATVERSKNLDVQTAARLAGMPLEEFKALNPAFSSVIPSGVGLNMLVPTHKAGAFESNLQKYVSAPAPEIGLKGKQKTVAVGASYFGLGSGSAFESMIKAPQGLALKRSMEKPVGLSASPKAPLPSFTLTPAGKGFTKPMTPTAPTMPTLPNKASNKIPSKSVSQPKN